MFTGSRNNNLTRQYVLVLLMLCCSIFQFSCKGDDGPAGPSGQDGTSDKQVRLSFVGGLTATDTLGTFCYASQYITRFNKSNYVGLDSIIFSANMSSQSPTSTCIVELYNVTDSVFISGGSLSTNAAGPVEHWPWIYSGNVMNAIPNKEITLGFRVRPTQQGMAGAVATAQLLLYRK